MRELAEIGSVIEYMGVRYLVYNITEDCENYECLSGYDFEPCKVPTNLKAGFRIIDNGETKTKRMFREILEESEEHE